MEIVPAIDIIDGKCVRLSKGNFNTSKIYGDNPLEMAKMFADAGLKRLHLVDLDGARSRHIVNTRTLESIAGNTDLIIDFEAASNPAATLILAFDCGASMVIGQHSHHRQELMYEWIEEFGE